MNDFGVLVAKYSATLPTLVDSQITELQVDVNGHLLVQVKSITETITAFQDALGTESFTSSNEAVDGLVVIPGTTFVDVTSIPVEVGQTLYIYGWNFDSDSNVTARLVVSDDVVVTRILKIKINSSATPGREEHFSEGGRIEVTGLANRSVKVQVAKRGVGAQTSASASIHARKII